MPITGHTFGILLLLVSVYVADWWNSRVPLLVFNVDAIFQGIRDNDIHRRAVLYGGSGDHITSNNNNNNNREYIGGLSRDYMPRFNSPHPVVNANNNSLNRSYVPSRGQIYAGQPNPQHSHQNQLYESPGFVAKKQVLLEQYKEQKLLREREEKLIF